MADPMEVEESKPPKTLFNSEYDRSELPDLLRIYYNWIFPYDKYYQWLSYDDGSFSNREFSFTLEDDIYVRYQSYETQVALEEGIKNKLPYKIDVGAVFNHKPRLHKAVPAGNFVAESKELVFDIDMTDYDDIRTCCSEANICQKCWTFIKVAIKIIDRALRDDFGFEHLLWVYSGRRGVHCWVCDTLARHLNQPARIAIVEYLTLVKGNEHQAKKVSLRSPIHPSIEASLSIIDQYFKRIVMEQEFLSTPEEWDKVLRLIRSSARKELDEEWRENPGTSWTRWKRLEATVNKTDMKLLKEIKLQYAYPRIDVNVTKGLNHLLKSPLCVHPKTGRVCVPIDVDNIDRFDPFSVPTISQLCYEHETCDNTEKKGYHRTSLVQYMKIFNKFLSQLKKGTSLERRDLSAGSLEF